MEMHRHKQLHVLPLLKYKCNSCLATFLDRHEDNLEGTRDHITNRLDRQITDHNIHKVPLPVGHRHQGVPSRLLQEDPHHLL
jgi:hypothetical protein